MGKLLAIILAVVLLLAVIAAAVFNSAAGQNALFARAASGMMTNSPAPVEGLRVVVCGSASPLGNVPDRAQACIAVQTPDHLLLFDVGARSPLRIAQANLPIGKLAGVFLTHFHSDHIAALPDVNLTSWVRGRSRELDVYGPPGVTSVVDGFNAAYSLDRGYRTEHHGPQLLPVAVGPMNAVVISPGAVAYEDRGLMVTSFLVDHAPIKPAVGYRVDYRGRSVVISGDTNAVEGLFVAAKDADLLLHDALSRALLDPMIVAATEAGVPRMPTIMTDVIDYHADSLSLEERAEQAGIKQLAYYHMVPVPGNALTEKMFARGLRPTTILVKDLHTFDLPPDSEDIYIQAP